jgi:hypothetical protein
MIVLFHEHVLLLSTYKFIITNKMSQFWNVCLYGSVEKQTLNAMSLVTEQRKNEFDRIAKVQFSPIYFDALRG